MINSIEEAFLVLEKTHDKLPIAAIEYLQNQGKNGKITEKIIFNLNNAYNDELYYDPAIEDYLPTPLWYAIVSENHLSEALIEPVINLYKIEDDLDDDILNQQGNFLSGKLCEEIGEYATDQFLQAILESSKGNKSYPVLFLFDCLFYINKEKHLPVIFEILENDKFIWTDYFITCLADTMIIETLGKAKEIRKSFKKNNQQAHTIKELDYAINILETGKHPYPEETIPLFKRRPNWKEEYDDLFEDISIPSNETLKSKKIGRNDPCRCGSGKKYKKCCLGIDKELGLLS